MSLALKSNRVPTLWKKSPCRSVCRFFVEDLSLLEKSLKAWMECNGKLALLILFSYLLSDNTASQFTAFVRCLLAILQSFSPLLTSTVLSIVFAGYQFAIEMFLSCKKHSQDQSHGGTNPCYLRDICGPGNDTSHYTDRWSRKVDKCFLFLKNKPAFWLMCIAGAGWTTKTLYALSNLNRKKSFFITKTCRVKVRTVLV